MSRVKADSCTHNSAPAYAHTYDHLLEFFSKAGSLFVDKKSFYGDESTALELFKQAWYTGKEKECMQLLFWLRDAHGGGAGNRSGGRAIYNWLAKTSPEWIKANVGLIPRYGRWDDLFSLYHTECQAEALQLWASVLLSDDKWTGLAAKWADRQDSILRDFMGLSPKAFRKLVVGKTDVVETKMCNGDWDGIEYSKVPSVALARYNKAFLKNDEERYGAWRKSLKDGKVKVNAKALYPHDIVRLYHSDESSVDLVEAQFNGLPSYIPEGVRIMTIVDFSGSMSDAMASGSVSCMDVALGLGLYCSDRLGKDNPFYRMLIPFSSNARLESWSKMSVAAAMKEIPNGYCGSTNIVSAFEVMMNAAKMFRVSPQQMPNVIIILSDMQFDQANVSGLSSELRKYDNKLLPPVEECLQNWEEAGYTRPQIIYWNLAGYGNSPTTKHERGCACVSGFSPSVLKCLLSGEEILPLKAMIETIEKYEVTTPGDK